jgi:hypothetical protein
LNRNMDPSKNRLIEVYRIAGDGAAEIIKSKLESNGVPAILGSQAAPSVYAFTLDGLGEYRITVPESKAEKAKQLIEGEKDV